MAFMAIAAGISAATGLLSAKASADAQRAGLSQQQRAADESMAFQREQYERWKSIYGDIEENLGEFYSGLTPEYITSQGLEQEAKAYETTINQVRERFGQIGVPVGAQADIEARLALESAEKRADIRAEAPYKTADLKQSFLSMGTGGPEQYGRALETAAGRAGQSQFMTSQQYGQDASDAFGAAIDFAKLAGRRQGLDSTAQSQS